MRAYVAEKLGPQYLVPQVQVADSPDEIDFASLPRPCVIKATHAGDMTMILREGDVVDEVAARRQMRKWLKQNFYYEFFEWPYLHVKPRLVVEEFIGLDGVVPTDYKCYVFNGRVGMIQVDSDRFTGHKVNLMNRDWKEFDVSVPFPRVDPTPPMPSNFRHLLEVAEKLGKGFDFVRIDLYSVGDKIYFGEFTHIPGAGRIRHEPYSFDIALGDLWRHGTPVPAKFLRQPMGMRRQSVSKPGRWPSLPSQQVNGDVKRGDGHRADRH